MSSKSGAFKGRVAGASMVLTVAAFAAVALGPRGQRTTGRPATTVAGEEGTRRGALSAGCYDWWDLCHGPSDWWQP